MGEIPKEWSIANICPLFKKGDRSLAQDVKEAAYKGLVRPVLEYGSSVWDPHTKGLQKCDGIASLGNMQISNSRLCESSKCRVYSAVNHPWWMSMLFHRRGFCGSARLFVTFGGSGGMMTTARTELPYPCSPQAKTRDESSRRGK